jgi:pantetheine-phosphate adenylyltransferase
MAERVGVYPGSFDPPTLGHLDLIERASHFFDRLIVAVASNSEKNALFSTAERIEMLSDITRDVPGVEVDSFKGLTVDFARHNGAVALVRGLRAVSDFEYELTLASLNRKMYPGCDTISLMPSEEYMFISSRLVKEIAQMGGDIKQFVPPASPPASNKNSRSSYFETQIDNFPTL